jgi:hypothetical protein
VADVRSRALDELRVDVDRDVSFALITFAGLPPPASGRELLRKVGSDVIGPREEQRPSPGVLANRRDAVMDERMLE